MDKETNTLIDVTIKNFKSNNMNAICIHHQDELFDILERLIPDDSIIGCGDSLTLEQLQVFDYLRKKKVNFLDKHNPSLTKQEKRNIYLQNFSADIFISSANAITSNGYLFNIDGNGSRVAPIIYGPEKVIIVVGKNKITTSVESAIQRARQIAAPLDAKRLNKHTPCTKLDRCIDCNHKDKICNQFVLTTHQFDANRIHVLIMEDDFGY